MTLSWAWVRTCKAIPAFDAFELVECDNPNPIRIPEIYALPFASFPGQAPHTCAPEKANLGRRAIS